ncbi:response regulator [Pseudoalteromonas luteoviolacea]|uniref:diguanylate cyclase n=1 Tax=Pseudoalteromonas luteoviolacea S4060-1 TaxID=1365257 RepID=A0A167NYL9_9GAMM|nr:response regulator [Pseudoalteromonas luteoviolacea]KZN28706.1 hypothetical protein N480_08040 [Pseudoalteromonas luteoviolacea S2607]KZN69107.1 hypothetical protein N478_13070 [Pseudoalteromonas luteoviolacea S4060-1]
MLRKVLIIEDTPTIAKVQKHIASSVGYDVDVATTLESAKRLINDHNYFCAVVDFVLPDATNGEAIPYTVKANIPTIVMTGNLESSTRDTVDKYPVIDYITKENKQAYQYLKKQLQRLPRNEQVKVLVVDDSAATRRHISSLLQRHKYQVYVAGDGIEALETLNQNPDIDVIITDNEMPRMRGEELCAEIRRLYSNDDKAIIGISGTNNAYLSARFLKSGANDYLRKPFNPEEFYCRLSQNVDMLENIATIRRQANTDYLTQLPNRRYFFEHASKQLTLNCRQNQSSMLAMIDIDFFKKINDQHGHDAGDKVLQSIGECFEKFFQHDLYARLGGEEFAVLFRCANSEQNMAQLEQFRLFLEKNSSSLTPYHIPFTVSIGVVDKAIESIDPLIKIADENLYKAKESGRNQIAS